MVALQLYQMWVVELFDTGVFLLYKMVAPQLYDIW
jgi:hypothetical protein